jgi:alpha-galactosidase
LALSDWEVAKDDIPQRKRSVVELVEDPGTKFPLWI